MIVLTGRRDGVRERRGSQPLAWMMVALVFALTAGCGLTAQSAPEPVPTSSLDGTAAPASPQSTDVVQIYLLRDERLVAVPRAGRSMRDAITLLAAGPTALDVETGLGTALVTRSVELATGPDPDVVVLEVTPEFIGLSDRERFLAVAQLVWTATEVCCATRVQVQLDARPLAVPADGGPAARPVRRDDYRSVGPP